MMSPNFLQERVRRVANARGLRYRCGKLAFELVPPVVTNKGDGIRRLIELHGLMAVIYLGDDVSDTDAFRVLRGMRTSELDDTISGRVTCRLASSADQFS